MQRAQAFRPDYGDAASAMVKLNDSTVVFSFHKRDTVVNGLNLHSRGRRV
jgi:hypothetical protein